MASARSAFLSAMAVVLFCATLPVRAQVGYSFRSGQKYPAEKGIDLRKPIGPGAMERNMNNAFANPARERSPEKPTVKEDSMVSYSREEGNTIKQIYTYSSKGNLDVLLTSAWSGVTWENMQQNLYTYDKKGNVLSESVSAWDGFEWVEYLTLTYTYNNKNQCTSMVYNDIFGGFTELITMTYDKKGNRTRELGQYWDGEGYANLEKWDYTYDKKGNRLSMLGQFWDGAEWMDYMLEEWTWRSDGQWLTDEIEYSDGFAWSNYLLYKNKYNQEGYLASFTGSYWYEGTGWQVEFGGKYKYDGHGNMVSNVHSTYAWWESPPSWIKQDSTALKFNYRKKNVTATGYVWTEDGWMRGDIRIYIPFNDDGNTLIFADEYPSNLVNAYYSDFKDDDEDGNGQTGETAQSPLAVPGNSGPVSLTIFPNPVIDAFTVTVGTEVTGYVVITLLDSQGKTVQQVYSGELAAGTHDISVKSIGVPGQGLFFLKAVSPSGSATVKLLRQ
jgi:hypothetical protein